MASITLPTTAVPGTGAVSIEGLSGVVLAQGQFVYKNQTTRKYELARSNVAGTSQVVGMVQQSVTANSPIDVQTKGRVTGLSGLTVDKYYVLANDIAGAIMPIDDLYAAPGAGATNSLIGYAISATELQLLIENTGIVEP